jgi:AcrR family transcriptional regulator
LNAEAKAKGKSNYTSSVVLGERGLSEKGSAYTITEGQRHLVRCMAANGMTEEEIAKAMDIRPGALKHHFDDELKNGFDHIKGRISAALVQLALEGNMSAIKYWLSNRCAEWRVAKDQLVDAPDNDDNEVVRFYLPSNFRDKATDDDGPIIDGKAEAT